MATLDYFHKITPFWDDEFKHLDYTYEPFNEPAATEFWLYKGYANKFTGAMCDMRHTQPSWNHKIVEYFADLGWKDIGTCYYRMDSGTILPVHRDKYVKYINLFNLQGKESTIRRGLILLEDWASGHYLELDNIPVVDWKKGDLAIWSNDTPHMAANMGLTPRYTLQVTGHLDEDKQ
jgi:hypothetical protein